MASRRERGSAGWSPTERKVRDRVPTVCESGHDVGGHGHESRLAELGVANAVHRRLQVDVSQGEAKALRRPATR